MKVCLFGSYSRSTNGIPSNYTGEMVKEICWSQGFETVECHEDCPSYGAAPGAYVRLLLKHRKIDYDVMVIPWRGVITLPLAKMIHRSPIVYFPTLSIYDTLVNTYRRCARNSLKARIIRFIERTACRWADLVVTESTFQTEYFVREFGLPRGKFRQLWPGAYESRFTPQPFRERTGEFVVLYFGTFIPMTGTDTIVGAADLLRDRKDIRFVLCGTGKDEGRIRRYAAERGLSNVVFTGMLELSSLVERISSSDVLLGLFGTNDKCKGSMPNKVNQALASAKPLITIDTPTAREAGLEDGENCLLTQSDDPGELAGCILRLRDDDALRRSVAMRGYKHYLERLSIDSAGRQLGLYIGQVCGPEKA